MAQQLYEVDTTSAKYDNLFADHIIDVLTKGVTLKAGKGIVKRGSVLGLTNLAVGTIVKTATNTGDPVIATAALAINAQKGAYEAICNKAASAGGANNAVFSVFAPDGSRLADATQNVAYTGGHLTFTIPIVTAVDSIVGDSFTINVIAGSGLAVIVNKANVDGSNLADCILSDDVDTGAADATVDVTYAAYTQGHFNRKALIFGGADTAADHEARLRDVGIVLKDNIAY